MADSAVLARLLLLAPYVLLLGLIALNAWRAYLVFRDAPTRRPRDVSEELRPVPRGLGGWMDELRRLNFERLGDVEVVVPSVGLLASLVSRTQRRTGWIFVDEPRTTEVALVERLVEFSSRLADGSYVETMFPMGEEIDEPDLRVATVRSSLAAAYAQHAAMVGERAIQHGPPRRVTTMAEQQVHDREYRLKHARRTLRRPLLVRALLPLALAALLITAMAWLSLTAIGVIADALAPSASLLQ